MSSVDMSEVIEAVKSFTDISGKRMDEFRSFLAESILPMPVCLIIPT
jgi:hypothetical protein